MFALANCQLHPEFRRLGIRRRILEKPGIGNAAILEDAGVAVDEEEAVRWFSLSAKQGMPSAMHELSFCYKTGRGVEADENEAEKWYCRAHGLSPTMERKKNGQKK